MAMRETSLRSPIVPRSVLAATAAIIAVLIFGVLALWVHLGTAVFYEAIVAGIAACL
jgi:hypothetical protein